MYEHRDEEQGIEVWDGGCETDDCSPGEAHGPVGHIVLGIEILVSTKDAQKTALAGLREYAHQPLVRRRLLQREGRNINMRQAQMAVGTYP